MSKNPWDFLIDVRPLKFFRTKIPPEGVPVIFEYQGTLFMGWQSRGALPTSVDCHYDELWVPETTRSSTSRMTSSTVSNSTVESLKTKNHSLFEKAFIGEAKTLVSSISEQVPMVISDLFESYDNQFHEKLGDIIKKQQENYEQLKRDKVDAEKLHQLEDNRKTVEGELKKIEDIIEQLS